MSKKQINKKKISKKNRGKQGGLRKETKILLGIALAVLLAVAIFVTVLLIVLGGGKTVMRVNGMAIDEELYSYWLSYGKYRYLAEHGADGAVDTPIFWASLAEEGKTHEEACREFAESYMIQMTVSSVLYDSLIGDLTESERRALTKRAESVLQYDVTSKSQYDRLAKEYGFSYSAMCEALLCMYKHEMLKSAMVGDDGSALTDAQLKEYYEAAYKRALVLEVRTKDYLKRDEEGDLDQNPDGSYKLYQMTEEEKLAAQAKIDRIAASLTEDGSLEHFEELHAAENEDVYRILYTDGYFFSQDSDFGAYISSNLAADADDPVAGILSQQTNTWRIYDLGNRTWIVYVTGTTEKPYEQESNSDFFHDLSDDAAEYFYARTMEKEMTDASVKVDREITDATEISDVGYDYRLFCK